MKYLRPTPLDAPNLWEFAFQDRDVDLDVVSLIFFLVFGTFVVWFLSHLWFVSHVPTLFKV